MLVLSVNGQMGLGVSSTLFFIIRFLNEEGNKLFFNRLAYPSVNHVIEGVL